MNLGSVRTK